MNITEENSKDKKVADTQEAPQFENKVVRVTEGK
jgi:hypothetical protein